ncbi:MAG: hypothetical protein H6656_06260 [Ardenticatenaceae bacterium]|nr:hypothetical protein [Ardenticatenaceae bacterium]
MSKTDLQGVCFSGTNLQKCKFGLRHFARNKTEI